MTRKMGKQGLSFSRSLQTKFLEFSVERLPLNPDLSGCFLDVPIILPEFMLKKDPLKVLGGIFNCRSIK